ncbi:MAG TPA: shikimate dehydrogenase [Firmicutes bacterium]|nr:shikimate dehydrogenase [Bacillota bacterium]
MERFAFIIHPLEIEDVARKFPSARRMPASWLETVIRRCPPIKASHITGVRSLQGTEAEGWFIGCLLTAKQMMELPEEEVLDKIIKAARKAEQLGAGIVGLGAFTAVVGDAGVTVADNVGIAVTTGNSYTVATALEGIHYAAGLMEVSVENASVTVLGATGSIGSACARILARDVGSMTLAARSVDRLEALADRIKTETGLGPQVTTDLAAACREADIVVAVTSATGAIVEPEWLKPGAIVCDVARPRNVSRRVAEARRDVLVFEGGVVEVPGDVDFGLDFGFPAKTAYACMAETMILALEGRYENFTLGRDLSVEQVDEISRLATRHGFRLAGLRSFERAVSPEWIQQVKENASKARRETIAGGI